MAAARLVRSVLARSQPQAWRSLFLRGVHSDGAAASAAVAGDGITDSKRFNLEPGEWTPQSRRTGLIAVKLGMSQTYSEWGERVVVTALQVKDNAVTDVKTLADDGYTAVQVGAIDETHSHRLAKAQRGHCERAGVPWKRKFAEFKVTEDALIPLGTELHCGHFVPGQYVDITAKTIGKGFQGVMKRHNFSGMPRSHGVTLTHRKGGGTGGGQDPGRIWPGEKMPGRMGGVTAVQLSLQVYKVDPRWNVVWVKGSVPGHKNTVVKITDARRKRHQAPPPFPTELKQRSELSVQVAPKQEINPLTRVL